MATTHLSKSGRVNITVDFHTPNKMWSVVANLANGERVATKFAMTEDDAKAIANEFWRNDGNQPMSLVDLASEFDATPVTAAPARQTWFDASGQSTVARTDVATDSQMSYLRNLLAEREVPTSQVEQVQEALGGQLTKRQASTWIDALQQHPKTARPQANTTSLPDVPAGHYATASRTGNNDLDFWRVDRPTQGQWAGRTFVKRVIGGHEDQRVNLTETRAALEAILAAGLEEASRAYGQSIGRCGRCNRSLTDETSRAYGIGPDCRSKGW